MVTNSLEAIDASAKLAASLGLTTSKLIGYQHAAELSGVSSETLQAALFRLSRQGLTLEQVAAHMAAIENPTERTRVAFELLGKQGAAMLPLLMGGADALNKMVAEGEELSGLQFVDTDQIEEANDAVTRMKAGFQGIANSIAVAVAPHMKDLADNLRALIPLIVEAVRLAAELAGWLGTATKNAAAVSLSQPVGLDASLEKLRALAKPAEEAKEAVDGLKASMGAIGKEDDPLAERLQQLRDEIELINAPENRKGLVEIQQELRRMKEENPDADLGDLENALMTRHELAEAAKREAEEQRKMEEAAKEAAKNIDDLWADVSKGLSGAGEFASELFSSLFEAGPDVEADRGPGDLQAVGAQERGSAEAFSSIFAAMRGGNASDQIAKAVADSTKATKDQTKDLVRPLDEIVARLPALVAGVI